MTNQPKKSPMYEPAIPMRWLLQLGHRVLQVWIEDRWVDVPEEVDDDDDGGLDA
jgi:hypothetical protein